jgi:hypothetical protein
MKPARATKTSERGQYPRTNGMIASNNGINIYGRPSRATIDIVSLYLIRDENESCAGTVLLMETGALSIHLRPRFDCIASAVK